MLINLATDVHRRRVRELRALERLPRGDVSVAADVVNHEFWRAVGALPDLQRNAVVLFNARKNLARSLGRPRS